ncbi:hypothetical protein HY498_04980 [Candidatus Woesearchaeota archaeon]|nr:hypothetical protein [Candidatus Woesearchaeota archaeon]
MAKNKKVNKTNIFLLGSVIYSLVLYCLILFVVLAFIFKPIIRNSNYNMVPLAAGWSLIMIIILVIVLIYYRKKNGR